MSLTAKANSDVNFDPVPAGSHVAICTRVIDLGTQKTEWKGQAKLRRECVIAWELCNEKKVFKPERGEEPYFSSKKYGVSLNEKATLRADLESWRGRQFTAEELEGFDITSIVGKPCLLTIVHNTDKGNTYANVKGVSPVPKGMPIPAQHNVSVIFSLESFDQKVFDGLSENMKKKISESPEYKALKGQPVEFAGDDEHAFGEEVPF